LMPMLRAEVARAAAGKPCAISPWFSVRLPFSRAERKAIAQVTTRAFAAPSSAFAVRRGRRERLTIGYMAQDFRDHPGLYLTAGLYRRHDRARFRVHAYPVKTPDAFGASILAAGCDLVSDLSALPDADAASRIHADGVDILVDLSVVGVFNRQGILRLRPAPIQVSWLGFAGTMSGHLYDYLIGDAVVTPPAHEKDYLEQIVRLPESYQINNRDQVLGPVPTRESEGLPEAGFIFACFCSADRIERDVFRRWMNILRQCPGSVLWLLGSSTTLQTNLRRSAAQDDVDPLRLVFAGRQTKAAHLGRFALADLHLDTGTFGAHTTGSDALWAGVPLLTKIGDGFPSRVGASLLHAIGLPELIAPDWDSYERLAVHLAQHPDRLAVLKEKLAANRLTQPLFDTDRSVRDLEALYETLWSAKR
jgi:protein O-GlcNAc transferase